MKECLVVTMRSDSFPRRSGRLVCLLLVATALSLTAACSQPPAPAPTPVAQGTIRPSVQPTAEAVPTAEADAHENTHADGGSNRHGSTGTPAGPPVFPVDPTTVVPPGTQGCRIRRRSGFPNGHGGVAPLA